MTATVLLQRFCYVSSTDDDKMKREALFLKTQTYSQRVVRIKLYRDLIPLNHWPNPDL
jgi:hypothetical protein